MDGAGDLGGNAGCRAGLNMTYSLVLASASPRRKQLLAQLGIDCLVKAVDIDESPLATELPTDYVQRIAAEKSAACAACCDTQLPILAADTTVVLNGQIMGKPVHQHHGVEMLQQLSGVTHQVYSAVSLRYAKQHWQALNSTAVTFRKISLPEMQAYWQTGEPCDKAGGYAIQGIGSIFVEKIVGSFSGVMGLPLFETAQLLTQLDIHILK